MNPARYIIRFLFTRLYVWVSRGGGTASLGMQVPELLPVVGDEIRDSRERSEKARPEQKPGGYG